MRGGGSRGRDGGDGRRQKGAWADGWRVNRTLAPRRRLREARPRAFAIERAPSPIRRPPFLSLSLPYSPLSVTTLYTLLSLRLSSLSLCPPYHHAPNPYTRRTQLWLRATYIYASTYIRVHTYVHIDIYIDAYIARCMYVRHLCALSMYRTHTLSRTGRDSSVCCFVVWVNTCGRTAVFQNELDISRERSR